MENGRLKYTTLPIRKYENFLTKEELEDCNRLFHDSSGWSFGQTSGQPTAYNIPFWKKDLDDHPFFADVLVKRIERLTGMRFELHAAYANGQTAGQEGDFHDDSKDDRMYTFLLYATDLRDRDAGCARGHTEFLLPDDTVYGIPPAYNTAILFPSTLYHRGAALGRFETRLRVTVAWKMFRLSENHSTATDSPS